MLFINYVSRKLGGELISPRSHTNNNNNSDTSTLMKYEKTDDRCIEFHSLQVHKVREYKLRLETNN